MQGFVKFLFYLGVLCLNFKDFQKIQAQNCPGFSIIGNGNVTDVICKGDPTGTVSILVSETGAAVLASFIDGLTAPNVMQTTVINGITLYTDTFPNLAVGTYDVIVGDNTFCTDTITITIAEPAVEFDIQFDSIRNAECGDNGFLSVITTGGWSSPSVFVWNAVDANNVPIPGYPRSLGPQLSSIGAGTYTVTATDVRGCTDNVQVTITGGSVFSIDLSILNGSLPLTLGDSLDLLVTPSSPSPSIQYTWFPNTALEILSNGTDSVRVKPCKEITYFVLAIDQARQCADADSITVTIDQEFNPWIPNIFNPDSFNPANNKFQVFGTGIEQVDMEIYDRKGAIVYENPDSVLIGTWDGSIGNSGSRAVAGKYLYVLKIRSICNDIITRSGGISLLR